MDRRTLLRNSAAAGVAGVLAPWLPALAAPTAARRDLIRAENEKTGTRDWMLTHPRVGGRGKCRCTWIEGYCSHNSIRAGEKLSIMVATDPPAPFVIDIYRLGYYQGHGGRHMLRLGSLAGKKQREPAVGQFRLRDCGWEPSAELTIPADWPSGVYLGKLTTDGQGDEKVQSYVIFIVRDDRACDFLFQCSDLNWAAYNRWPDRYSLYIADNKPSYYGPDVHVSFNRPYAKFMKFFNAPLSTGSGEFLLWEFPIAYWMEKEGYDVSYISNLDTHADGAGLLRARSFLSVGHDEYWTRPMYDHIQAAIAAGMNVAFLSGNAAACVTGLSPDGSGNSNRAIRRLGIFGGFEGEPPEAWAHIKAAFPEFAQLKEHGPSDAMLIGGRSTWPFIGQGDWVCAHEKHWLFADSGMKNGDGIPGLVGWEFTGRPAPIPGLEVVAQAPVRSREGQGSYTATIYPGPKGNFVFSAATIWWGDGLSAPPGYQHPVASNGPGPKGPDRRIQQITRNLFERFTG